MQIGVQNHHARPGVRVDLDPLHEGLDQLPVRQIDLLLVGHPLQLVELLVGPVAQLLRRQRGRGRGLGRVQFALQGVTLPLQVGQHGGQVVEPLERRVGLSQGLAAQAPLFALMSTGNVHGGNGGCSTTPRLGRLTPEGDGVWRSAGGLRYGPDPRYGNRVQHVLRHAEDDATRAVEHGVFDAGRAGTLGVIDEAWAIAQRGGPGVASVVRGNRVEYTIDMGRRIGYVGGRSGAAAGHPAASHIRLIIANGTDVITAYPIIP